ncbi:hypothetical protein [Cellulomonas sp. P24]|uniref:hypothetical protein n=1 Tax=Cellulomonas sp. P24 TaxID=2885206 RepID=UPI00216ACACF|nr:hypothetical protein [Cellulomonas sp. P24]MCR6492484.1 hypothetical protein [Cellulomonas sp. P24]
MASIRWTWGSETYVAVVAACATLGLTGLTGHTAWPVLLAAAISLPASVVTLPGYYVVYALLGLVPGANPSSSSGSGSADAGGHLTSAFLTGTQATWFTLTTAALGVLLLTAGAVVNVVLVRVLVARRRGRDDGAPR